MKSGKFCKIQIMAEVTDMLSSFRANSFRPTNFITANPHWQTIIGSGALQKTLFGNKPLTFTTTSEVIDTPDGDFFDVDYTQNIENSDSIAIVLHGLESNNKSGLVCDIATALLEKGFSCCLISFRGCSGKLHRKPGGYHLGFTDDLHHMVQTLHQRYPEKSIYACGFSLGGNVTLKYLGEQGDKLKEYNFKGAAVTCVPFDPTTSHHLLNVGFNHAVYASSFLGSLIPKAEKQHKLFPTAFDMEAVRKCKTLGEFDDAYISKIYNFEDRHDYYRQAGSKRLLSRIRVPAFAINAIDDPLIEPTALPTVEDVGSEAPVRLIYHQHGGHCGFSTSRMSVEEDSPPVPAHGWIAEELSRCLQHIRQHSSSSSSFAATAGASSVSISNDTTATAGVATSTVNTDEIYVVSK